MQQVAARLVGGPLDQRMAAFKSQTSGGNHDSN